jgi:uncharacterized membrane protein YuzA (DUF378 family)
MASLSAMDPSLLYYQKLVFKISMVLVVIGALNWFFIGLLGTNFVEKLLGKTISRGIYVLVGLAAISMMFNRDTYLPFLGETVLPCTTIPERVPPGATKELHVNAAPGSKILYWAAEPAMEELKQIPTWQQAYNKYENAGVTTTDSNGVAVLKVRAPQAYLVPFKGRIEPHVHFRICDGSGMLGRIKTIFVSDERVEGFSLQ